MDANCGRMTVHEIAADHAIHPIQVTLWQRLSQATG